jgi:hypothetical protein
MPFPSFRGPFFSFWRWGGGGGEGDVVTGALLLLFSSLMCDLLFWKYQPLRTKNKNVRYYEPFFLVLFVYTFVMCTLIFAFSWFSNIFVRCGDEEFFLVELF